MVNGLVLKRSPSDDFDPVKYAYIAATNADGKIISGRRMVYMNFAPGHSKEFEMRRKIFGSPWSKYYRIEMWNNKAAKPIGGRFDLMIASEPEA